MERRLKPGAEIPHTESRSTRRKTVFGFNPDAARQGGFSLMELLTVVAMIFILMSLIVPAITSTQGALQITRGAQGLADSLSLSRQIALTRNRNVALRFYRDPGAANFSSYQVTVLEEDGSEQPQRLNRLPDGIVLSGNALHSLGLGATGTTTLPGGKNVEYAEVRFRRDGLADIGSATEWYVTVVHERFADRAKPDNFVALVLEPDSGIARILQP